VERDKGVAPVMMSCVNPGCDGLAYSLFDAAPELLEVSTPAFEWYRPDATELASTSEEDQFHVENDGLLSRPTGDFKAKGGGDGAGG